MKCLKINLLQNENFCLIPKIWTTNQFGYQSEKSTVDAVLDVFEIISKILSAKDYVASSFMISSKHLIPLITPFLKIVVDMALAIHFMEF